MMEFQQPWPAQPWLGPFGMADSLQNIVSGLGTAKDPRTANVFTFRELNRFELESAYRSDWVARIVVDAPADDATREWREWQANQDQIAAIEKLEQGLFLQKKMRQALVRARLYGGACLMIGVDDGKEPEEELDIEKVGKGDLRYLVVLNRYELNAGPRIYDVGSPWYTRPVYYSVSTPLTGFEGEGGKFDPNNPLSYKSKINAGDPFFQVTPNSGLLRVHPSRIVEFAGNELPDWRLAPLGGGWGDSVLQTVDDALKDWAMTVAGVASMVNDAKVDVISVPGLSERASSQKYRDKLINRFSVANMSKSINNSLLIDKDELWQRIRTNFGDVPQLLREMMVVVAGAGRIPVSRLMGQSPGRGLSQTSGGEQDMINYYDTVASQQKSDYTPRMLPLDEVLIRAALGTRDPAITYKWGPLYRPDPKDVAQIQLQKAQATQVYVSLGLINTDAMREGVINQLIEDAVYPGFEDAIDDNKDGVPDEPTMPLPGAQIDPKTGLPFPGPQGGPRAPGLPPGRGDASQPHEAASSPA
jgi:hypothetical protein